MGDLLLNIFGFGMLTLLMGGLVAALIFLVGVAHALVRPMLAPMVDIDRLLKHDYVAILGCLGPPALFFGVLVYHWQRFAGEYGVLMILFLTVLVTFICFAIFFLFASIAGMLAGICRPFVAPLFAVIGYVFGGKTQKKRNVVVQEFALALYSLVLTPIIVFSMFFGLFLAVAVYDGGRTVFAEASHEFRSSWMQPELFTNAFSSEQLEGTLMFMLFTVLFFFFSYHIGAARLDDDVVLKKEKRWTVRLVFGRVFLNWLTLDDTKQVDLRNKKRTWQFFRPHHVKRYLLALSMGISTDWYFQTILFTPLTLGYAFLYIFMLEWLGVGDTASAERILEK